MGLFNDAYDEADVMMTKKEKGPEAADAKKEEIEQKRKESEEKAEEASSD